MTDVSLRRVVTDALAHFTAPSLLGPAVELFGALGYRSNRRFDVNPAGGHALLEALGLVGKLNAERALLAHWHAAELIFQLTAEEILTTGQMALFDTRQVDQTRIESYLFLAIDLSGASYTRTELATITREINRHLLMPVLVLFRHGATLTFAVIDRRLHKLNEARDVLEKVTLIKDIAFSQPHRAHIEILADLCLPQLAREASVSNFVELHRAWRTVLDSSALNRRFYREVANWYFWAVEQVEFPAGAQDDRAVRNAPSLIRLITRVIFVWFLKEKGLIPDDLFNPRRLREILTSLAHNESSYYQAILQNLFFATLNQEMNTPQRPTNRTFRGEGRQHYNITTLYRHKARFRDPDAALALFATIPFLNGGLFECLDKADANGKIVRVDGFSDRTDVPLRVPNELFFGAEHAVDLNATYGTSGKHYQVAGLITILQRYKFTVSENTPIEEEVALDPELLGQVFENLLAAYNPETQTTARKQTGSFYTPRPIVNYMVDEALVAYLEENLHQATRLSLVLDAAQLASLNTRLRGLMTYTEADHGFSPDEVRHLIIAINNVKILDPAAGSGAFPMGVLQKLVHLLTRLDPDNTRWKEQQRARAIEETKGAFDIGDRAERERRLLDINEAFEYNSSDYGRKLYLIENCIYGVDIQPIAIQIAKLRCFISLVVDQRIDDTRENRGIRPLPNLETKFVAANTLVGITSQGMLRSDEVLRLEKELATVRSHHFSARTPTTKRKYRDRDRELRMHLGDRLEREGIPGPIASQLASWDPYDQNIFASFFDSEWMFGLRDGFDIIIANPPYVRQEQISEMKPYFKTAYPETYSGTADLFVYFFHQGVKLLRHRGCMTYISSNAWLQTNYAEPLRRFIRERTTVDSLIDLGNNRTFESAPDVCPSVFVIRNVQPVSEHRIAAVAFQRDDELDLSSAALEAKAVAILQHDQPDSGWQIEVDEARSIVKKLITKGQSLSEFVENRLFRGVLTGLNEAFIIDQATHDRLVAEDSNCAERLHPMLRGEDLRPWYQENEGRWLILFPAKWTVQTFGKGLGESGAWAMLQKLYPSIAAYLEPFAVSGRARGDKGDYWWELRSCSYYTAFDKPKIFWPDIAKIPRFSWDTEGTYINDKGYIISIFNTYLLGILQSRVLWFLVMKICLHNKFRGGLWEYHMKTQYISRLPIPDASDSDRQMIGDLAMAITAEAKSRYALHREAREYILNGLGGAAGKLNNKLTAWWDLDFPSFQFEVRKALKRELSPKAQAEWEPWLAEQRTRHEKLTATIIDGEIELNARVYRLFDLTDDEIKLIEESTKYKYGEA